MKDLELKVEELQRASDDSTQENGLLRAQVERLHVELREYRKRLTWVTSGSGVSAMSAIPGAYSKGANGLNNSDFYFDFPKFGDLPGSHIFNNGQNGPKNAQSLSGQNGPQVPGVLSRNGLNMSKPDNESPASRQDHTTRSDSGTPKGSQHDQDAAQPNGPTTHAPKINPVHSGKKTASAQDTSNSDSPCSSCDSHHSQIPSSKGTSPEPHSNSPTNKPNEANHGDACGTIDGETSFCAQLGLACGNIKNPIPAVRSQSMSATNTPHQPAQSENQPEKSGLDTMAQENGGEFDPVLFGDWREPQDAILSQDFGTFFDDAFPLPDLGSPSHNFNEVLDPVPQKKNPIADIAKMDDDEEVVPGEDQSQMLSCNKIWYVFFALLIYIETKPNIFSHRDRLQSMDKFRNGEIDVDNLCSELRTKARCSEGGVVVNQSDVDDIMGRAK